MRKDLIQTWNYRGVRTLIVFIPLVVMILIPLMFFIIVLLVQDQSANAVMRSFMVSLPKDFLVMNFRQQSFGIFTEYLAPLFLIIVSIICSISSASCSFVLERDKSTLETVMLSPLNSKSIYHAKLSGSVIMSLIITFISFFCYLFFMIIANVMLSMPFFFSFEWLLLLFLLLPAIVLFCTIFISLLAPKFQDVSESFQMIGYILLFFVIIYLLQFLGVYSIDVLFVFLLAVLFLVADFFLYNYASKRFTPDKWLTSNFLKKLYRPKDSRS